MLVVFVTSNRLQQEVNYATMCHSTQTCEKPSALIGPKHLDWKRCNLATNGSTASFVCPLVVVLCLFCGGCLSPWCNLCPCVSGALCVVLAVLLLIMDILWIHLLSLCSFCFFSSFIIKFCHFSSLCGHLTYFMTSCCILHPFIAPCSLGCLIDFTQ